MNTIKTYLNIKKYYDQLLIDEDYNAAEAIEDELIELEFKIIEETKANIKSEVGKAAFETIYKYDFEKCLEMAIKYTVAEAA